MGLTPLHSAAEKGYKEIAELLLAKRPGVVDATAGLIAYGGCTPLHLAAQNGRTAIVELLVASKADVNARNDNRATPLHLAAEKGHKDVVELLLANKANANAIDRWDHTPLDLAGRGDHKEVEELLRPRRIGKLLHSHHRKILKWQKMYRFWLAYLQGKRACRRFHQDMVRRGWGSWPFHMETKALEEAMDDLGLPSEVDELGQRSGFVRGWRPDPKHISEPQHHWPGSER